MSWRETYVTKDGTKKYIVRDRKNGEKFSLGAGPLKATAYEIQRQIDESKVRGGAGLLEYKNIATLTRDFLVSCEKAGLASTTIHQYRYSLKPFVSMYGDYEPLQISAGLLEQFKDQLFRTPTGRSNHLTQRFYTVNGVKIILRTVCVFFNYLQRLGYVRENPARKVDNLSAKEVWRTLSHKEQGLLLKACSPNPELYEIVLIALRTGMRENEIIKKLSVERIWDHHIHFKPKETKRNKRGRRIPIVREIAFVEKKVKQGLLYPRWSKNRLIQAFNRAVKRAKLGRVRFHDLKHTFCSDWLKGGGHPRELQEITGNSAQTLEKYTHFEQGQLREKAERIFTGQSTGHRAQWKPNGAN